MRRKVLAALVLLTLWFGLFVGVAALSPYSATEGFLWGIAALGGFVVAFAVIHLIGWALEELFL